MLSDAAAGPAPAGTPMVTSVLASGGEPTLAPVTEGRSLRQLADELAWLALALRGGDRAREPGTLRKRVDAALADFAARARAAGHRPDAVGAARFALAALLDETLAEVEEGDAASAATPLDQRLATADDFFERLEQLRDADDRDADVLDVFHLCLLLGYRGRYRFEGMEKLRYLVSSLGQELARMRGDRAVFARGAALPPAAPPPPAVTSPLARIAIVAVVACAGLWVLYRVLADRRADAVVEAAQRILAP